jgi:hypothetical protein
MTDPPEVELALLREFIAAEQACPDPPAEASARVLARLAGSVPDLGAGTAPGPSVAPSPAGTGRTLAGAMRRGWATFLVGAAVGATTYGTVQHLRGKPPEPPPVMVAVPSPPPAPAPSPPMLAPAEPAAVNTPPRAATAPSPGPTSEPGARAARDLRLGAERKLVEMARSALARGHVEQALAALRAHARSHPLGQLAEERDSLMVQAVAAKGDAALARTLAARFHRRYPTSLFGPVVDEALRSIP